MILSRPRRAAALLLGLAPLILVAGCAKNRNRADTQYVARDVSTLYNAAKQRLDKGSYAEAAVIFDEVERQHPYSPWARRAQLMAAFSYYGAKQYTESIQASQRFLSIHPGNRDAPYAYYLIALCYYEQIGDVTRDQKITQQAHDALGELIRRFPNSRYAADGRLKLDLVNDHLAGKEMEVGRFYERRRQWIAAATRFRKVIDTYQTTTHTPEALERLVESYLSLGLIEEAKRTASVLNTNYPGSEWYDRSYALIEKHAPTLLAGQPAVAVAPAPAPQQLAPAPQPAPASRIIPTAQFTAPAATTQTYAPRSAREIKAEKKAREKAEKKARAQAKAEAKAKSKSKSKKCKGGLFHRTRCEASLQDIRDLAEGRALS